MNDPCTHPHGEKGTENTSRVRFAGATLMEGEALFLASLPVIDDVAPGGHVDCCSDRQRCGFVATITGAEPTAPPIDVAETNPL
jgi:hypothetical protein